MEKLAKQLNQAERDQTKTSKLQASKLQASKLQASKLQATKLRTAISEADRKIKLHVIALEDGIEPALVKERIAELRTEKKAAEDALAALPAEQVQTEDAYLAKRLSRLPDLSEQLRTAPPEVKRQMFQAFQTRIEFDKTSGRIGISVTVTEAVARAFTDAAGTLVVPVEDIAGAGSNPRPSGYEPDSGVSWDVVGSGDLALGRAIRLRRRSATGAGWRGACSHFVCTTGSRRGIYRVPAGAHVRRADPGQLGSSRSAWRSSSRRSVSTVQVGHPQPRKSLSPVKMPASSAIARATVGQSRSSRGTRSVATCSRDA